MKIKKVFLLLFILFSLSGCVKVDDLSYDDIINNISITKKKPNTYNQGYKFYIPKGLGINELGSNYAILSSKNNNYYVYIDLISYYNKNELNYQTDKEAIYSQKISFQDKFGYIKIKLWQNDKYLIEFMYNYAKIEVMVDKDLINDTLINCVNILSSIKYDDTIIKNLLNDDKLDYTEEIFDMFKDAEDNSNILHFEEDVNAVEDDGKPKDTDYVS